MKKYTLITYTLIGIIAAVTLLLCCLAPISEKTIMQSSSGEYVQALSLSNAVVSENSQRVNATIYPSSAIDKSVDWSVEWANPNCLSAVGGSENISTGKRFDRLEFDTAFSGTLADKSYILFENGTSLSAQDGALYINRKQIYVAGRWMQSSFDIPYEYGRVEAYNDCPWVKGVYLPKSAAAYVKVTPDQDGALSATASVLLPFSDPIRIVATSRANVSASASILSQYAKKLSIYYTLDKAFAATSLYEDEVNVVNCIDPTATFEDFDSFVRASFWGGERNYIYSEGTLTPETTTTFYARPSAELYEVLQSHGVALENREFASVGPEIGNLFKAIASVPVFSMDETDYERYIPELQEFCNAVQESTTGEYDFEIEIRTISTYTGETGKTVKYTQSHIFKCRFDRTKAPFLVNNITSDQVEIIF